MIQARLLRHTILILFISWLALLYGCAHKDIRRISDKYIKRPHIQTRFQDGWFLVANQPVGTRYRVLLLPGFLCTDGIYRDMLTDMARRAAAVQLVAGNPPGFKGLPVEKDFDFSIASYAKKVCDLNDLESYDLIVGHSFFANVLIEVAVNDRYQGRLMLLSPSLSRDSEDADTRFYDRITRVPLVGRACTLISYQMMYSIFEPYFIDEKKHKIDELVIEAQKTPRYISRRLIHAFFDHIDKHGDLAERLTQTNRPVMYVRGVDDNVKLLPKHRKQLAASPLITLREFEGSKHFVMIDYPGRLNRLIIKMLGG